MPEYSHYTHEVTEEDERIAMIAFSEMLSAAAVRDHATVERYANIAFSALYEHHSQVENEAGLPRRFDAEGISKLLNSRQILRGTMKAHPELVEHLERPYNQMLTDLRYKFTEAFLYTETPASESVLDE